MKLHLSTEAYPHVISFHDYPGDGNCFRSSLSASPRVRFSDGPTAWSWHTNKLEGVLESTTKKDTLMESWDEYQQENMIEHWASSNRRHVVWDGIWDELLLTWFLSIHIIIILSYLPGFYIVKAFYEAGLMIEQNTNAIILGDHDVGRLTTPSLQLDHFGHLFVESDIHSNATIYTGRAPPSPTMWNNLEQRGTTLSY